MGLAKSIDNGRMVTTCGLFTSPTGRGIQTDSGGQLKAAVVDSVGTLRLAWWVGNEQLKGRKVIVSLSPPRPIALTPTT